MKFGNIEIEKPKFHSSKKRIHLNKVIANKIVVLSKGCTYDSSILFGYKNKKKKTPKKPHYYAS